MSCPLSIIIEWKLGKICKVLPTFEGQLARNAICGPDPEGGVGATEKEVAPTTHPHPAGRIQVSCSRSAEPCHAQAIRCSSGLGRFN